MPTVPAARLKALAETIFQGAGVSAEESEIVARHCIDANLAGHDSHGVMRVVTYCDRVDKGHIVPGAPIEIEKESPTTLVVNGNWGFGFTVTETIMKKLIEKAKTNNVAVGTIHYQGHIGRLADYPLMAIRLAPPTRTLGPPFPSTTTAKPAHFHRPTTIITPLPSTPSSR